MKTNVRPRVVFLLAATCAGCGTAYADPGGQPSGSASARPPHVPLVDQPPPPEERSPAPSKADWQTAPIAPEVRVTDPGCTAKRLREWYRVECGDSHVSLVAGTREGVDLAPGAWITFPARRGDRRLALFARHAKYGMASDAIVSEQWLDGDPAPMITVIGIPG